MVEMHPVSSGHIEAIGWEDDVMIVKFKGGPEYAYHGISFDTYESIKEAPNVGKALNSCGVKGSLI